MICTKCGNDFVKTATRTANICNPCNAKYQREYMREYRIKNKNFEAERHKQRMADPKYLEWNRKRGRDHWAKLRQSAIQAYGGNLCACCGETEPRFLTLDHINNDGAKHRKEIGDNGRGAGIYKWLRDNGYPPGFQILCMNCNHGKAMNNGICPHKSNHIT